MIYFVTGATGFIGAALVKKLAHDGHQVRALVRNLEKADRIKHQNVQFVKGTLNDKETIEQAIEKSDGIFHLAAFAQPWAKDKTLYNKINVVATDNIFSLARKHRVKRIVFTSSAGTMGPSFGKKQNEKMPRTVDFFNEYESTKFMAEKIAKDYVLKGTDIVIVHPSRVYGPGYLSKSNAVTMMVKNYINGKWRIIPGNGKRSGNYVFIDDVVKGHILAMERGKPGEQYLLGGENHSYESFFSTLKSVSGKNFILVKIPVWLLKTFAAIQMQLALLVNQKPLLPPKWVKKYLFDWEISSKKAQSELQYTITPLSVGFEKTIKWLKNESYAK